jgi:hypothetical protein
MATLRFPKGASAVLGVMLLMALVIGVVAVWPGTLAAQDSKSSQPSAKPDQPPAPPPLFDLKKEPVKTTPPPVQPPGFGPPAFQPKDIEKQRQIQAAQQREILLAQEMMIKAKFAIKRFQFNIDPKTPLEDLLPKAPKVRVPSGPLPGNDLTKVPEVSFQEMLNLPAAKALEHNAHTIAKINHVNQKKTDSFMEALLGKRVDLAGLPFAMGDDCRTKGDRSRQLKIALATVRAALGQQVVFEKVFIAQPTASGKSTPQFKQAIQTVAISTPGKGNRDTAEQFWDRYLAACLQEDKADAKCDPPHQEHVTAARIAALMQILGPEPASLRKGLVKFLAGTSHVEATRALAKLAIFSPEVEIRQAAIDALKVRRERDYTAILLTGLHYPLPAVAQRTGQAIVKLERNDLIGQLVNLLDEPDPRLPVIKTMHKKQVPVVRELVRVNHHRNCLLCHAPGNTPGISADVVTAPVPTPGEPFPSPSQGYGDSQSPDILVRIDVTYLRQDFSLFQPVADAHPWPEMQRFDFLVRNRELTEEEAARFKEKLTIREAGVLSPYHRTALAALRDLTGRDTEPTAQAWRKLLHLSK